MPAPDRVAVLLDGEYVKKILAQKLGRFPTEQDVRNVEAGDVIPKILQKGVDMRIGLDIAALALKRLVSAIVIVSGDSDLVPALKLARREGLRVYLDALGNRQIRPDLKKHADRIV